ncbi:MAG TPA: UbiA family prenyltransferase [Polyangiaceae bacterium]|nr:UbiA family prenyltransferase [Polyangiaceae bacterium]
MKLRTLLELGRTSNLPTVWSNVLCGALLSGAKLEPVTMGVLLVAGSAFYEGGMLLNDAFDADIDAKERPDRPIPAGRASKRAVLQIGFGLLALGLLLLVFVSWGALLAGAFTAASVLVYDRWHKGHAWAPIVMGFCRAGLYMMAALAVSGTLSPYLLAAAAALLLYIVGLTHVARFETGAMVQRAWVAAFVLSPLIASAPLVLRGPLPLAAPCWLLALGWTIYSMRFARQGGRMIGRAVVSLIAGVSLIDATFIALTPQPLWSLFAIATFLLTLSWQRRISGT